VDGGVVLVIALLEHGGFLHLQRPFEIHLGASELLLELAEFLGVVRHLLDEELPFGRLFLPGLERVHDGLLLGAGASAKLLLLVRAV
jgi:hypothetical protein